MESSFHASLGKANFFFHCPSVRLLHRHELNKQTNKNLRGQNSGIRGFAPGVMEHGPSEQKGWASSLGVASLTARTRSELPWRSPRRPGVQIEYGMGAQLRRQCERVSILKQACPPCLLFLLKLGLFCRFTEKE